jgi:hypothetical protein
MALRDWGGRGQETVNSIVEWYRPGSSTSPEALADGVCAIAFDGLVFRK